MRIGLAGLLSALAIAAAGCGGDDGDDVDGTGAEEAAQGYVDALQSRDFEAACGYFGDEELEGRMGGLELCVKSMKATTTPHALDGFEITGSHEGEEGKMIVEFTIPDQGENEFFFVQEDGKWVFVED